MIIHWLNDCEKMIPEYKAIIRRMTTTLVKHLHKDKISIPKTEVQEVQGKLMEIAKRIIAKQSKRNKTVWQQQNGSPFWDCMGHVHPELTKMLNNAKTEYKPQFIIKRMQQEMATHIQNILAKCKKTVGTYISASLSAC